MLKNFVFKKISKIEIPKSSKLHRYVHKVRKLYHARSGAITDYGSWHDINVITNNETKM